MNLGGFAPSLLAYGSGRSAAGSAAFQQGLDAWNRWKQQYEAQEFEKEQQKRAIDAQKKAQERAFYQGLMTTGISSLAGAAGGAIAGAALPTLTETPAATTATANPAIDTSQAVLSANKPASLMPGEGAGIPSAGPPMPQPPVQIGGPSVFAPPTLSYNPPSAGQRALVGGALGGLGAFSGQNLLNPYLSGVQGLPLAAARLNTAARYDPVSMARIGLLNAQTGQVQALTDPRVRTEEARELERRTAADAAAALAGQRDAATNLTGERITTEQQMRDPRVREMTGRAGAAEALETYRRGQEGRAQELQGPRKENIEQRTKTSAAQADVSRARLPGVKAGSARSEMKLANEQRIAQSTNDVFDSTAERFRIAKEQGQSTDDLKYIAEQEFKKYGAMMYEKDPALYALWIKMLSEEGGYSVK